MTYNVAARNPSFRPESSPKWKVVSSRKGGRLWETEYLAPLRAPAVQQGHWPDVGDECLHRDWEWQEKPEASL